MSAEPRRGGALLPNLVLFGRMLRRAGLDVHTGRLIDAVRALAYVDLGRRADVHHSLTALLVHRHEDLILFDRAFDAFWRKHGDHWGRSDLRALGEQRSGITLRFTYKQGKLEAAGSLFGSTPVSLPVALPRIDSTDDARAEIAKLVAFGKQLAEELVRQRASDWLKSKLP